MSTGHIVFAAGIVLLSVSIIGGLIANLVLAQARKKLTRRIQKEYR